MKIFIRKTVRVLINVLIRQGFTLVTLRFVVTLTHKYK